VVGVATWAWTDTLDTKSPVQVSAKGAATAVLSAKGDMVTVRDGFGKVMWRHTPDKTYNRIALSSDGNYIAAVGGGVSVLHVPEQRVIWRWDQDGNQAVDITPDGEWLAAGGYAGAVYLFGKDSSQPRRVWPLDANDGSPKSVAISDDGQLIAAAVNTNVYLFNANSGPMLWAARADNVQELKMSSDGRYVLGIASNAIYLWDKAGEGKAIWQKKYGKPSIGAAISSNGDKIAVSHPGGVSILNTKGEEVRKFEADFGDSDLAMSSDGRYIYVNDGSKRLYAFDDSYSYDEMRPYRVINDINPGQQRVYIAASGQGNWFTYPKGNQLMVEEAGPGIISLNMGAPLLGKDQEIEVSSFVTNPSGSQQALLLKTSMVMPNSITWWADLVAKVANEPEALRSKLLDYQAIQLQDNMVVHSENLILPAGSSQKVTYKVTVPDLTKWATFDDYMSGILSNMNQSAILERIIVKITNPLVTLVGEEAASLGMAAAKHAINPNSVEIAYPVLGLGTVTLYGDQGKALDQDSFYFLYIKR
jgi:WD40 repeat protein